MSGNETGQKHIMKCKNKTDDKILCFGMTNHFDRTLSPDNFLKVSEALPTA